MTVVWVHTPANCAPGHAAAGTPAAEPLAKLPVFHHHALCCCGCSVLCFILQAEARLSTQRAAVQEAEAAVQEALRRLREAEVRGAQAALCMIGKILILR
jgi:hypothetical protein